MAKRAESEQDDPSRPVPDPAPGTHERFLAMLGEMEGVFWEMDARTWRFTFVSERAERLFGFSLRQWYDEATFWQDQLLHPEDREWCIRYCSTASGECRNHAFLYRARTADGRQLWIKDVVRVIPDATGEPSVMRGVMLDVTEEMVAAGQRKGVEIDYDAPELERYRAVFAA